MDTMNPRLTQAIAAARAGKTQQAKVLLDRVVSEEPENLHAWFLLSVVSESREEQIECLNQVLAIDPEHEGALKRMALLEEPKEPESIVESPPPPSQDEIDVEAAPEEEIPGWLEEDLSEEYPESDGDTPVVADEEPTTVTDVPSDVSEAPTTTPKKSGSRGLEILLFILVVVAIIIVLVLAYLVINPPA